MTLRTLPFSWGLRPDGERGAPHTRRTPTDRAGSQSPHRVRVGPKRLETRNGSFTIILNLDEGSDNTPKSRLRTFLIPRTGWWDTYEVLQDLTRTYKNGSEEQ